MESNYICFYFDDIIKFQDFDLDNILIYENLYKNILVYNIPCKTLIDNKLLHIRFNKVDGVIRVYDRTRYSVLFGAEKYDFVYNKIRVNSHDSLSVEKRLTFS